RYKLNKFILMENKNIIIILFIIVVILAEVDCFMILNHSNAKDSTKLKITSDKSQYEGGKLSVILTDLNGTAISKEIVNITITDNKGKVVVDDVVKTNSKGKANLNLNLKKGKYDVNVTYGGNENYTGNNTTQKLTIKEEEVVEAVSSQSDNSNNQRPSYLDKITVEVDPESGGSITDLSQLTEDEFAQYLGYSDADEMNRETERKRAEAYARN
ncbi:MAG: hypothetical protein VZR10_08205, partial [Methanobrevibacter sp.]|nr:hypothetical protein [Methanobrevibacter sp.]